jgi:hypothetical protein
MNLSIYSAIRIANCLKLLSLRFFFVVATFLLFSSNAIAQIYAPKYSNEFLSIGVGARAHGLSNAQVGVANDVTAGYWNPAGLLHINTKYEASLMHAEYFAGIANYDYAGLAYQLDTNTALGATFIRFGVDNIADTRFLLSNGVIDYSRIQTFSIADYALILSFAKRNLLFKRFNAGINFKIIHRTVGSFGNAWGFGLDGGAQYHQNGWMFGLMARDVTSTFNAWTFNTSEFAQVFAQTGNQIPESSIELTLPKWIFGMGKNFKLFDEKLSILPVADFEMTFDGARNTALRSRVISIDPRAGLELGYGNMVFVRVGVGNIQQIKDFDGSSTWQYQPNFGVGFRYKKFQIDYALTDLGNQSEALYSNIFSLKLGINPIKLGINPK